MKGFHQLFYNFPSNDTLGDMSYESVILAMYFVSGWIFNRGSGTRSCLHSCSQALRIYPLVIHCAATDGVIPRPILCRIEGLCSNRRTFGCNQGYRPGRDP